MLPKILQNFIRVFSILISVVLIIQPWFCTVNCEDRFLLSSWNILVSGIIASCLLSVLIIFFKPKGQRISYIFSVFSLFLLIVYLVNSTKYLPTLRSAIFVINTLVLLLFFKYTFRKSDYHAIASTIALSGACMAIYCIFQKNGIDCLVWQYKKVAVGTLANQNYCGIFLIISAMITLGCACDISSKDIISKLSFWIMFILQAIGIFLCEKYGISRCFFFSLIFYILICKKNFPFGFVWRRAYLSGFIIALFFTGFYWASYKAVSDYNWSKMIIPSGKISVPARLVMWKMGFDIFKEKPILGSGPGIISFLMQKMRPFNGNLLGLRNFDQDPHSTPIKILAELGFLGFWLICTIICMMYGVYARRALQDEFRCDYKELEEPEEESNDGQTQQNIQCQEQQNQELAEYEPKETLLGKLKNYLANALKNSSIWRLPWTKTVVATVIVYYTAENRFISKLAAFYSIPLIIAFSGVYNTFMEKNKQGADDKEPGYFLRRANITTVTIYLIYSLFNNSFDMESVSGFMIVVFSMVFVWNMSDTKWQKKFSFYSLPCLVLPCMFAFAAYTFQMAHHSEYMAIYNGSKLFNEKKYQSSLEQFTIAIQNNPQSLQAYYGSARCYEMLGNNDKSMEMYRRLDSIVPNVYGANYNLARKLLENGKILEAHRYAIKNIEREHLPTSFELLVEILLYEGKTGEAEAAAREGLYFVPAHMKYELASADRLRYILASIVSQRGEYDECKKFLDDIKGNLKNDKKVLYLRSMLLIKENKEIEALEAFEKLLSEDPESIGLLNAVGYLLCKNGDDLERSQVLLEKAYHKVKNRKPVLLSDLLMVSNSLGILYWKQGKFEAAGQLLKISYEQCPDEWKKVKEERYLIWEEFQQSMKENQDE